MNKKISLKAKEKEEILIKLKAFLQRKPEVLFTYLFGSFIKGGAFQDLDAALYLKNDSERKVLQIEREIEGLIHLPVEATFLNKAPLSFAFRVIKEGHLIFVRDDKTRCDFEEKTRVFYFDFLPFYKRYYKEVVLGQSR